MRDSLRPRLLLGFSAALVVLGSLVALTYLSTRGFIASSREANVARSRRMALEAVLSTARDVETGQRGFLITGEAQYLEPYATALTGMAAVQAQLDSLSRVPGIDAGAIATIRRLLDRKLGELANTIHVYRSRGPEAARAIVRTELGRQTMDSLRHEVAALERTLTARVAAADAVARRNASRTLLAVSVLAALAFLLFGMVCLLLWRALLEGLRRERTLEADRAALDLRVREQTSEVRRLNADLTRRVAEVEALFAVVPIGLGFASDPDCRDIRLNPAFGRMLRLTPDQNASKSGPTADMLPFRVVNYEGEEIPAQDLVMQRAARTGQPVYNEAYQVVYEDGTALDMLGSGAPLFDEQGRVRGAVGAFADVTERRRAEERLRHAERLQAVGQLAGGVAHEINNLMTTVLGFAEFALREVGPDHAVSEDLRQVLAGGRRAALVAQQLLAFSRRQAVQPRVLRLQEAVEETLPTLRRLLGANVGIDVVQTEQPLYVRVDLGQLHQVLINLAANARDAMTEHGRLTVRTAAMEVAPGPVRTEPGAGAYAVLSLSDTGTGMDVSARRRAFEPFFTTKGVGKGTGLGLSIVYGIVKQAGGDVRLSSEPGRGTTVEIFLPRVEPEEAAADPAPEPQPSGGGGERILLVEDDETVRALAQRTLEEVGFRVSAAEDGSVAMRLLERDGHGVRLIVTDLVMPNVGGRALRRYVGERYPDLPVLYISGYTGDDVARPAAEDGTGFLAKPFTPDELVARVRAELERARSAGLGRR